MADQTDCDECGDAFQYDDSPPFDDTPPAFCPKCRSEKVREAQSQIDN